MLDILRVNESGNVMLLGYYNDPLTGVEIYVRSVKVDITNVINDNGITIYRVIPKPCSLDEIVFKSDGSGDIPKINTTIHGEFNSSMLNCKNDLTNIQFVQSRSLLVNVNEKDRIETDDELFNKHKIITLNSNRISSLDYFKKVIAVKNNDNLNSDDKSQITLIEYNTDEFNISSESSNSSESSESSESSKSSESSSSSVSSVSSSSSSGLSDVYFASGFDGYVNGTYTTEGGLIRSGWENPLPVQVVNASPPYGFIFNDPSGELISSVQFGDTIVITGGPNEGNFFIIGASWDGIFSTTITVSSPVVNDVNLGSAQIFDAILSTYNNKQYYIGPTTSVDDIVYVPILFFSVSGHWVIAYGSPGENQFLWEHYNNSDDPTQGTWTPVNVAFSGTIS